MIRAEQTRGNADRAPLNVRIAVYPGDGAPEVIEVSAAGFGSAATKLTRLAMEKVVELGGAVPETPVREVIENLIHADYRGVVISVMDNGDTVRVSDRGPGISEKARAMEFGFSGSSAESMREIRGIGAGLGIALAQARKAGGSVVVEDNLGGGTVVTISISEDAEKKDPPQAPAAPEKRRYPDEVPRIHISERQQKALITVLECGEVGPSTIADMLEVSVSTAYRDLSVIEEHGLVIGEESGKRVISPLGRDYVEAIVSTWVK